MSDPLATRRFTMDDQRDFAVRSGDCNPMHVDPVAARRTQAGVPVVHGVNAALWALDTFLAQQPDVAIVGLGAQFERFVAVDDTVTLMAKPGAKATKLEVRLGDARLMTLTVRHEPGKALALAELAPPAAAPAFFDAPVAMDFAEAAAASGSLPLGDFAGRYPHVEARLGADRIAALACLSYLVGMAAPGLHSIFSSFEIGFSDTHGPALAYRVTRAHDVFRLLDIDVAGGGIEGRVQAFVRLPPVVQPSIEELRPLVAPDAFAGVSALVVGGSRGLGEVTAKLLAAGGAKVAITYAVGADDAAKVTREIADAGLDCTIIKLNALEPVAAQIETLPFAPNQLYYFATTKIFLQKGEVYAPSVYADFHRIYVDGFAALVDALAGKGELRAFYPSSVAVADRPKAMTEYAMAKSAAELLCADLDRYQPGVRTLVRRLPRLLTDQTATVTPVETPPATDVMLEVVTSMQAL